MGRDRVGGGGLGIMEDAFLKAADEANLFTRVMVRTQKKTGTRGPSILNLQTSAQRPGISPWSPVAGHVDQITVSLRAQREGRVSNFIRPTTRGPRGSRDPIGAGIVSQTQLTLRPPGHTQRSIASNAPRNPIASTGDDLNDIIDRYTGGSRPVLPENTRRRNRGRASAFPWSKLGGGMFGGALMGAGTSAAWGAGPGDFSWRNVGAGAMFGAIGGGAGRMSGRMIRGRGGFTPIGGPGQMGLSTNKRSIGFGNRSMSYGRAGMLAGGFAGGMLGGTTNVFGRSRQSKSSNSFKYGRMGF